MLINLPRGSFLAKCSNYDFGRVCDSSFHSIKQIVKHASIGGDYLFSGLSTENQRRCWKDLLPAKLRWLKMAESINFHAKVTRRFTFKQ